ncbi:phospholipase D-like domain-containing protein [Phreatobacter aquaticus]|nr:phospholipase D-like domain-containing protein [Phreatobacter aquaticus]
MAVSYSFSFGRRWSIIEHMLLVECAGAKRTALELSIISNLPQRLVIEALINLLRANWVEVRSQDSRTYFAATVAGRKWASQQDLPERLQRDVRWDAVCVERVTGHWMRADDLDLVHERDLPAGEETISAQMQTFKPNDAALRDLFRLNMDESLEPETPQFRPPSPYFARIGIAFGEVQTGLPPGTPMALRQLLLDVSAGTTDTEVSAYTPKAQPAGSVARDDIGPDDLIVGGDAHLAMLKEALEAARSTIVIHSCFISPNTIQELLPDLERAARRRVRIELLWGLHNDPESNKPSKKITDSLAILATLPPAAKSRVCLSPDSSGSHAKIIIYDDRATRRWVTIVGSCNFLSSEFDWLEVSLRTRSLLFATKLMSRLLTSQLPSVGTWSGTARRLNAIWSDMRQQSRVQSESGTHSITLLTDRDHYACITHARDVAKNDIELVCDLYGLAAEISVLVPMETAAKRGVSVRVKYSRPSKFLLQEGHVPCADEIAKRGISIERLDDVHAKYIGWDEDDIVISSFNWMATSVDNTRSGCAEVGAYVSGPAIRTILATKLACLPVAPPVHGSPPVGPAKPS